MSIRFPATLHSWNQASRNYCWTGRSFKTSFNPSFGQTPCDCGSNSCNEENFYYFRMEIWDIPTLSSPSHDCNANTGRNLIEFLSGCGRTPSYRLSYVISRWSKFTAVIRHDFNWRKTLSESVGAGCTVNSTSAWFEVMLMNWQRSTRRTQWQQIMISVLVNYNSKCATLSVEVQTSIRVDGLTY